MGARMGTTPNKSEIFLISSAGVVTTTPLLTLDQNVTTAVKGIAKNGVTVTFSQLINDPVLSDFLSTYAPQSSATMEEVTLEDGTNIKMSSGDYVKLLLVTYGGSASDGTNIRRKVIVNTVEVTSASGDETFEYGKYSRRSFELQGVKWNGSADVTIPAAIFDDTLVMDTDTTPGAKATWVLPSEVVIDTFGDEYWVKLPA